MLGNKLATYITGAVLLIVTTAPSFLNVNPNTDPSNPLYSVKFKSVILKVLPLNVPVKIISAASKTTVPSGNGPPSAIVIVEF